jgi:hypothetical protein
MTIMIYIYILKISETQLDFWIKNPLCPVSLRGDPQVGQRLKLAALGGRKLKTTHFWCQPKCDRFFLQILMG